MSDENGESVLFFFFGGIEKKSLRSCRQGWMDVVEKVKRCPAVGKYLG